MEIICITGKRGCGDAMSEFIEQGEPFGFHTVQANYSKPSHKGIKLAHVAALGLARSLNSEAIIVEDDVQLTSKDSLFTFNQFAGYAKILGYDIALGGAHHVNGSELSGFHMYRVLTDRVDFSLCPDSEHIDNWAGRTYKVAVCCPMVAIQRAGWSERTGKDVDYSEMFERYPILR